MMPKMDGWAVLTALKADRELADIPVVMLTIMSDKEMGYVLGASEYLTKPIDRDRLAGVLEQIPAAAMRRRRAGGRRRRRRPARCSAGRLRSRAGRWSRRKTGGWRWIAWPSTTPALILLDLMMPEMDGFEFLAELRQNRSHGVRFPVVVLTSKDLTPEERRSLTGKVERILQKGDVQPGRAAARGASRSWPCAHRSTSSSTKRWCPPAEDRPGRRQRATTCRRRT